LQGENVFAWYEHQVYSFDRCKKLAEFAKSHQNSDGGYSFCRPIYGVEFPSSISETYYALAILSMLQEKLPKKEMAVEFIKSMYRDDGTYNSPEVAFYTIKSLRLLNERLPSTPFAAQLYNLLHQRRIAHEGLAWAFSPQITMRQARRSDRFTVQQLFRSKISNNFGRFN